MVQNGTAEFPGSVGGKSYRWIMGFQTLTKFWEEQSMVSKTLKVNFNLVMIWGMEKLGLSNGNGLEIERPVSKPLLWFRECDNGPPFSLNTLGILGLAS